MKGWLLAVLGGALAWAGCARAAPTLPEAQRAQRVESMYREYKAESFPEVPDVSAPQLLDLERQGGVVVVDVRTAKERKVSIIPGAISKDAFEAHLEQYRKSRIVTYCTIGYRSGLYAEKLRRRGLDAYNLAGSILAWTHAGAPLVDPHGTATRRVHVYGATWNLVADGYEAVW